MGNRIHWRGDDFNLKDGRLYKIMPKALTNLGRDFGGNFPLFPGTRG